MHKNKDLIVEQIRLGNFILTLHAQIRMSERFISVLDIVNVAKTLKSIKYQDKNDTYLLVGKSTWNEPLTISVAFRNSVIIVTVFFKRSRKGV